MQIMSPQRASSQQRNKNIVYKRRIKRYRRQIRHEHPFCVYLFKLFEVLETVFLWSVERQKVKGYIVPKMDASQIRLSPNTPTVTFSVTKTATSFVHT